MLTEIFRNELVVPEFEEFTEQIREIFEECRDNKGGKVRKMSLHIKISKGV